MIFLQVIKDDFGIDQLISSISAGVTLLAFGLTFITLVHNARKEKKESENRSKKTLNMMDFILEDSNETAKKHLEKIEFIKDNTRRHYYSELSLDQTEEAYQKWNDIKSKNGPINFYTLYEGIKVKFPSYDPYVRTKNEENYIILEIFRVLKKEGFLDDVNRYQKELKKNLENQHLNITSGSLEKISNKIHGLKECERILESIRIEELLQAAYYEEKKTEAVINELLGKDMHEFIEEDYKKITELTIALEKVTEPLGKGVTK